MATTAEIAYVRELINEPDDSNGWTDERIDTFIENNRKVFQCPMDRTRFPAEGLSYEYQPRVSGKTFAELAGNGRYGLHEIWLTYDFDPVHGIGATSRTFLYADGHVE